MLVLFVLLVWSVVASDCFDLTILHTNDVHARFEQTNTKSGRCSEEDAAQGKCFGGTARMVTKVREQRALHPNSVFLSAGDEYLGTLLFYKYRGNITAPFMNMLGYDVMALGNHEFDYGISDLVSFLHLLNFNVTSANIDVTLEPSLQDKLAPYVILEVGGERIGVIGYTTRGTPKVARTGPNIKFTDEVSSIQKQADTLTSLGINKIIAVGHSGFSIDKAIAEKVTGLDVVVGGHTNTFLYTGTPPSNEKPEGQYPHVVTQRSGAKVFVVQDYVFGKYLGSLQVVFDSAGVITSWGGNPILLDNKTQQDPDTLKMLEPYKQGVLNESLEVVGRSMVHLEGHRFSCRVTECNLGNLIADAMVRHNLKHSDSLEWNHVAIAVINGWDIRGSLPKGDITVGDLLTIQPFRNTVDIVELAGVHVREMLEYTASEWKNSTRTFSGFLQVSGMQIVYDMKMPVGKRVISVKVRCTECQIPGMEDLVDSKVYKIIMPSFLANGGNGHSVIRDNKLCHHVTGYFDTDVTIAYIKTFSPIRQGLEGRITFRDFPTCPCKEVPNHARSNNGSHVFSLVFTSMVLYLTILSLYD